MQSDLPQSPAKRASFAWRAMTSVLIAAAFLLLVVSGAVLFVSPPDRVATPSRPISVGALCAPSKTPAISIRRNRFVYLGNSTGGRNVFLHSLK